MLLNHPVVILVNYLAWRNKFCLKQCHTVKRKMTNMLLMFDWTCLLSFVQKTTFSTERTFVWFVDHNKFVFCLRYLPCIYPEFEVDVNANVFILQISQ